MVANFVAGGAAINVLGAWAGLRVVVVDVGVASPIPTLGADPVRGGRLVQARIRDGTADMTLGPSMTRAEALRAVAVGIDLAAELSASGVDLVGIGEMGIGNTTAASAICAVLTGRPVAEVTGRGTGIDDATHQHKIAAIERALEVNRPDRRDPIGVLAAVGGLEIALLVGVILGAAEAGIPVVLDGFITGAAALVAVALQPAVAPRLIAAHRSIEPGHAVDPRDAWAPAVARPRPAAGGGDRRRVGDGPDQGRGPGPRRDGDVRVRGDLGSDRRRGSGRPRPGLRWQASSSSVTRRRPGPGAATAAAATRRSTPRAWPPPSDWPSISPRPWRPARAIVTSPLRRAHATATAIAEAAGIEDITIDERWREADFGIAEGLTFDELERLAPDLARRLADGETEIDWPDGEPAADLAKRVTVAWREVIEAGEAAVVVSHAGPLRIALGLASGRAPETVDLPGPGAVIRLPLTVPA